MSLVSSVPFASTNTVDDVSTKLFYFEGQMEESSIKPSLVELVKSVAESIIEGLNFIIEPIKKLVTLKKLAGIALLPVYLVSFVKNCITFPQYNREKKIDAALNSCNNLREIGESIATFCVGLKEVRAISAPLVWVAPFVTVISFLSVASILSHVRTYMKVKRFMKELNFAEASGKVDGKDTLKSFQKIVVLIESMQSKDRDFISDMYNISEEKLGNLLRDIKLKMTHKLLSQDSKELEEVQVLLKKTITSLKDRVKQNLTSSIFAMISSTVNLIGITILLIFPVLPIGWAILGIGTLVDGARFVHHKVSEYKFAKSLEFKRTKWEWMTC